ncbi:hypothetical protein Pden_4374 [Paracoccus denitrificans PD1222]|uniref:Uncharacterized protein n=1 Tax=Paracoccus denitrificans (strain Pd 1222) TaxID=318586 RepID=A1BA94_PARDP|nr:hypothetical protein Pden_4374 [Paracoccus denitrificans PD1222]
MAGVNPYLVDNCVRHGISGGRIDSACRGGFPASGDIPAGVLRRVRPGRLLDCRNTRLFRSRNDAASFDKLRQLAPLHGLRAARMRHFVPLPARDTASH